MVRTTEKKREGYFRHENYREWGVGRFEEGVSNSDDSVVFGQSRAPSSQSADPRGGSASEPGVPGPREQPTKPPKPPEPFESDRLGTKV